MQLKSILQPPETGSWINLLASLSKENQIQLLADFQEKEIESIEYDWLLNARITQWPPSWNWRVWLILAGRGFGKTRTGAEWVRMQVKRYPFINLIGATADDARDIMIEGESGILAICPKDERPEYKASKRQLCWPNGAKSLIFTADEPERLRGKQHMKIWADELCAWRYQESWDQAMFGLRLGDNPQALVTTTPKPTRHLKELVNDPKTHLTKGRTYDNSSNLSPAFLSEIVKKYEGTRLGLQELEGKILDDNPNALWKRSLIDELRVKSAPETLKRVVIGLDPAVTSDPKKSDETGIIVAGLGSDDRGYTLADFSCVDTPMNWAKKAVEAYRQFNADLIVGEVNNGGELIKAIIRTIDPHIPFKAVHATRGKAIRAEPISNLYEQKKISHVGNFPELEDQMCEFDPLTVEKSPDRMDALVWAYTDLMLKPQRDYTVY